MNSLLLVAEALTMMDGDKPFVIDYDDPEFPQSGPMIGDIEYETFIASGDRKLRVEDA